MPQGTTEDGFDTQMGINVLGHWSLLSHLLPIVVATPGARMVTLSSTAFLEALRAGRPGMPPIVGTEKEIGELAAYLAAVGGAAGGAK